MSGFLPAAPQPPQTRLSEQLQPRAYSAFQSGGELYIRTYRQVVNDTDGWRKASSEMTGTGISVVYFHEQ